MSRALRACVMLLNRSRSHQTLVMFDTLRILCEAQGTQPTGACGFRSHIQYHLKLGPQPKCHDQVSQVLYYVRVASM